MSKVKTEDRATELSEKPEPSAKLEHFYETTQHVVPDDDPNANDRDARGTEIGKPE
jgi:hypothetical protein